MEALRILDELMGMVEAGEKWYTRLLPGFIGKSVVDAERIYSALLRLRSALAEGMAASETGRGGEQRAPETSREWGFGAGTEGEAPPAGGTL